MREHPRSRDWKMSNERIASVSVTKRKGKLSMYSGAQQPQSRNGQRGMPGAQQPQAHGNNGIITLGHVQAVQMKYVGSEV